MTRCESCGHEFHNFMLRERCPSCNKLLGESQTAAETKVDDNSFDGVGFAFGMATGVPLSPTHGISTGSILGAALHSEPSYSAPDPTPDPSPSYDSSSSSSSYDSSSSSFDNGSSGGGSSD